MRISDWSSDVCSSDLFRRARVGCIDDAERRRAALDERQRGADIFGGRDLCSDAAPDAEMRQRRLRIFSRGHRIGIGEREAAGPERRRNRKAARRGQARSEEHTSELQSLLRISYAVFCFKTKKFNT